MLFVIIFIFELIFLFFLSRELTKSLSTFFYHITKSQNKAVLMLAFVFFPGVVVHELAHLLVANILFVKTGEIEFVPQITKHGVKLGSVVIAKTDPLRRMLIGVAPVFIGLLLVIGIAYFFIQSSLIIQVVQFYTLFVVSNTMFSSYKDMEGVLEIIIVAVIFAGIYFIAGGTIDFSAVQGLVVVQEEIVKKAMVLLSLPIVIDLSVLGVVGFTRSY